MTVSIAFANVSATLRCRSLDGEERLGRGFHLEAVIEATEPIATSDVLGLPALVALEGPHGERRIAGVVARWTAIATTRSDGRRGYRALIRPALCRLELRRRSRVFRKLAAPAIVQQLLTEGGYGAVALDLITGHAEREHCVQYEETDAAFVQRLCEDDGIYLRFSCEGDRERVTIEDDSRRLPDAIGEPLAVVEHAGLLDARRAAHLVRVSRRARPGKVMLDDYDPSHPSLELRVTAQADDASAMEREAAVYLAPGGYREAGEGDVRARYARQGVRPDASALAATGSARARLLLEARRADASLVELETNVMALAPGLAFRLEPGGEHLVVGVAHRYRFDGERHTVAVTAIPQAVPFRLPRVTPRPRIAGLQTAITTGAPGEEIHTDGLGCAFVRYLWDIDAPRDHQSSKAIRTLQPNMPDSMLLPRVGWEVLVAHEDGDPERPYVVGRSYTGRMMPPFALPANKTITSFATDSSPGAGGRNSIHIDDAAGREHLKVQATFGRAITVGDKMTVQTGNNERHSVSGDQLHVIGGKEAVSVGEALLASLGSLTMNVGSYQEVEVKGDHATKVGSEVVLVGAAQIEQAGNPVDGAVNLITNKSLQVIGSAGTAGQVAAGILGVAKAIAEGGEKGGAKGAAQAGGMAIMGTALGLLPGGEALTTLITGATQPNPWDHGKAAAGTAAPGGGAGAGQSDASGPSGPGPGHRTISSSGFGLEVVNDFTVATPGQIGWTTNGAAVLVTAGSKTQQAASGTFRVAGVSLDELGSRHLVIEGKLNRKSTGPARISMSGALTVSASGKYNLHAPKVTLDIGGALTLGSAITLKCGNSQIVASGGLVGLSADKITFSGLFKQSEGMAHA